METKADMNFEMDANKKVKGFTLGKETAIKIE
jgi:hypothetical protein